MTGKVAHNWSLTRIQRLCIVVGLSFFSTGVCAQSIDGLWRSSGWGLTLEVSAGQITIGEITEVSHLRFGPLPLDGDSLPLGDGTNYGVRVKCQS